MKESSNTTQGVEHRGFQTSDRISGSTGIPPQVHHIHLMDVVHRPVHLHVFELPKESCLGQGSSRAYKSNTLLKLFSYWPLTDCWSVRSI